MDPIKHAKRLAILVIGSTVMIAGLCMMVLPGPGVLVILASLGILATEFVWARHLLKRIKENAQSAANSVMGYDSKESFWTRVRGWFTTRKVQPNPHSQ